MTTRLQRNAAAGDLVAGLAVDLGAVENTLQVGYPRDGGVVDLGKQVFDLHACLVSPPGGFRRQRLHCGEQVIRLHLCALGGIVGQDLGSDEQIMGLNACALAGAVGQHFVCFKPTGCLTPPNSIVRLLELALLATRLKTANRNRPTVATASSVACKRLKRLVSMGEPLDHSILLHVRLPCGRYE